MLALAILLAVLALSANAFAPRSVLPAYRFSGGGPRISGLQPYNHLTGGSKHVIRQPRGPHSTRLFFVQTAFAAVCALSVFGYVWSNIDSIMASQKIAMDKAIGEQTVTIQKAQDEQKRTIEAAQKKQQDEIERIRKMQQR
ncbi:hypothetical protein B484DRAFT_456106 [Ochromonadaceae sp. CCMP2298]|nr:hypothetical protein B484DRAFT_456106 [Ochromonadaceae sp. CCMP2298]|mmetsp:Transcript_14008/g.30966  ORF Transcript_14008/g.30966 Transcript_14008/m.30966 type:complete len:141 (+) Transcript_14008:136-558(+)